MDVPEKSALKKLFIDYIQDTDFYRGNDESPETIESYAACMDALSAVSKALKDTMSDNIYHYGMNCEELGFINGFRHAVQIMTECMMVRPHAASASA